MKFLAPILFSEIMLTYGFLFVTLYTVKPLNNGQVGAKRLVHYSEVVLYWEVFIINALYLYTMLSETGSAVRTLLR